MPLTFTTPPTHAQTQAALAALPDGFAALGETILQSDGVTADTLLIAADALDAGSAERSECLGAWDVEARAMKALATILRDAAPRYPHPPRLPAAPAGAEAAPRPIGTTTRGFGTRPFGQRHRGWPATTGEGDGA
jgi:hypothetical protein